MAAETYEFRLADVGEGLHEAEIKRWLVQQGDRVTLDQSLVEVETDKAVVELPSPVAGTVARLGGAEGDILHVGEVVAVLEPEGVIGGGDPPAPASISGPGVPPAGDATTQPSVLSPHPSAGRALATPAVRKRARDLGVDLAAVSGSGPDGRVLASDVEAFARAGGADARTVDSKNGDTAPIPAGAINRAPTGPATAGGNPLVGARLIAPAPPLPNTPTDVRAPSDESTGTAAAPVPGTRQPLRGLRRRIAQTMTQAWTTIPHITGFDEVEVAALVAARDRLRPAAEARGVRLGYLAFVIKSAAIALRELPVVNASLDEAAEEIVYHSAVNVGIATATPDGLIVPVLHDAAGKTLIEIQRATDRLTERARARQSTPEELRGGTFTITNFGALGGWQAAPIIRPGEAAILGVGRIQQRPWVVDGRVEPRPILALSLSADHRLIDGDVSTAFLTRVGELLSDPTLMLLAE